MLKRAGTFAAGVILACGFVVLAASPLSAATASSGCTGTATSTDANGKPLDKVSAPGAGGTNSNPFEVDPEGTVKWAAKASAPIKGTWSVETKSTPKLSFSGDGTLDDDSGTEPMKDHLVVDVPLLGKTRVASGKFYVKVVVEGTGGTCTFAGYVKINGSPLGTPLFWGGVILGLLGLVLAFTATPTATAAAGAGSVASAPDAPPEPADAPPALDEPPPPALDEPPPPAPDPT